MTTEQLEQENLYLEREKATAFFKSKLQRFKSEFETHPYFIVALQFFRRVMCQKDTVYIGGDCLNIDLFYVPEYGITEYESDNTHPLALLAEDDIETFRLMCHCFNGDSEGFMGDNMINMIYVMDDELYAECCLNSLKFQNSKWNVLYEILNSDHEIVNPLYEGPITAELKPLAGRDHFLKTYPSIPIPNTGVWNKK